MNLHLLQNGSRLKRSRQVSPVSSPPIETTQPTQPLQLSILTQFYPPDYAATGQFVEELAQQLSQQNVEVQVFTGQPGYAFETEQAPAVEMMGQVRVQRSRVTYSRHKLGRTLSSLLFCLRSFFHLLKRSHQGDIVLFVSEPPYLQTLGYIFHRLMKMRYACLVYDLYPDAAIELQILPPDHALVHLWHAVNRQVWQQAETIIVPSETMKERIVARAPELSQKVAVIHNWADPTWIKPLAKQDNEFAKSHHLVDRFTVLYSGNMGRCHDMDTILEAARELKAEPIRFLFIGAGPKWEPCQQKVQEWGLTNCEFLPYQDKALLPQSLTACDLSLVSIAEGMEGVVAPSKFYSALSSGRPVAIICEPHSYLRQLVGEANCGAAFCNGDSQGLAAFIRYMAKDSQMHDRFGNAGHRYIQSNFTPELISHQYLKVLQRAVFKDQSLQQAIERQEFRVFYQPIVSLITQRIRGFEVSMRWQHPERDWVCPAEFWPTDDEPELMIPLSWWVLNEACRQLRYWQIEFPYHQPLTVSVSLSVQQFLQPALIPQLDRILDSNHLEGSCLTLKIPERALMADAAATTAILLQLQTRHIQVCLDSFGTDYASLKYLHRFPIHALAINPTFVGQLDTNSEALRLMQTTTMLAQDLGMTVHAEGITTAKQLQHLKAIGIQSGQGSFFSGPVEVETAQTFMMQFNPSHSIVEMNDVTETGSLSTSSESPLVLIIDDERMMRMQLRRAVEKEGYRAVEAANAEQGIELYRSHQPDLVLLDAMMPGMDGFTCCQVLHETVINPTLTPERQEARDYPPILMITGLEDSESVDRAFAAGATDYITKPINWAVLRQRLHRLLQRS